MAHAKNLDLSFKNLVLLFFLLKLPDLQGTHTVERRDNANEFKFL